jgi:hypothetical protein
MTEMNFYNFANGKKKSGMSTGVVNLENWNNQISERKYHNFEDYSKLKLSLGKIFFLNKKRSL